MIDRSVYRSVGRSIGHSKRKRETVQQERDIEDRTRQHTTLARHASASPAPESVDLCSMFCSDAARTAVRGGGGPHPSRATHS
eukprot:9742851-Lingulodinium_polyedra.AAC.1